MAGSPAAAIFAPWGTRVVAGYPLPLEAAIPLRLPGTALSWSFGDGAGTNEDVAVRHAWATPGLYDVVLAVTNLGGSVAAESTPGAGTCFILTLPATAPVSHRHEP